MNTILVHQVPPKGMTFFYQSNQSKMSKKLAADLKKKQLRTFNENGFLLNCDLENMLEV